MDGSSLAESVVVIITGDEEVPCVASAFGMGMGIGVEGEDCLGRGVVGSFITAGDVGLEGPN